MLLEGQKKRYSKNQSCFIQAVISSNYVEINQQFFSQYHVLKESQTLCSGIIILAKTKVEIRRHGCQV